jgi:hypothetical protein
MIMIIFIAEKKSPKLGSPRNRKQQPHQSASATGNGST